MHLITLQPEPYEDKAGVHELLVAQWELGKAGADGGEHHEIGDGGWLMMTMATDSPLRSPERTPD